MPISFPILAIAFVFMIMIFAIIYYQLPAGSFEHDGELTFSKAAFTSVNTQTLLGSQGSVVPATDSARAVIGVQSTITLVTLFYLAVYV